MACDCKEVAKTLLDLRKSLREEEAAVDVYSERGQRAKEGGRTELAQLYQEHVLPEEQQHYREFADQLTKLLLTIIKECDCPELAKVMW